MNPFKKIVNYFKQRKIEKLKRKHFLLEEKRQAMREILNVTRDCPSYFVDDYLEVINSINSIKYKLRPEDKRVTQLDTYKHNKKTNEYNKHFNSDTKVNE